METARHHREKDPVFAAECKEAMSQYHDVIEKEIHRRGVDGIETGVYHNGIRVATERKYSDALITLMAKRHIPDYKDSIKVDQKTEVSGAVGLGIVDIGKLSKAGRQKLRELLQAEGVADGSEGREQEEAG